MGNGVLPVRGARRLVEMALLDTIGLALRRRGPAAATTAALAAVASTAFVEGEVRFVTAAGVCYRWAGTVTTGGVQPTDRVGTAKPGRWLPTSSTITAPDGTAISACAYATPQGAYGTLRAVQLYQGEGAADWDQRILARRPAVLIQWAGETGEQVSNLRGALKIRYLHFILWGISFNARPGYEAALGSAVVGEAANDPGISTIMDDLEDLLDGLTGAQIGVDGIDHLRMGDVDVQTEALSRELPQRLFVWSAPLDVRCTVGKEDRPTRHLLDAMTATGVDPDDGTTPLTPPQYKVIP